ncbi:DNA damage-regulated autophagy modulator protein 1 [Parasteatoda tepidariorum]|uniref:DNA damage-regulated autophagy modulator protein 1 n=1 Tax=Parasteatoda tepidariorum TaxID=114398 RepID=UPI00077FD678|nr:DNA damage-regulated autophagy modulator protein 1 [Parasteatoda tepidariorum]
MFCLKIFENYFDRGNMDATISFKKLYWLPAWQSAILLIGSLIGFIVALANEHVTIYIPFFSETGAEVPEICIFSYTLIIGSFLGVLIVCHRYLILRSILSRDNKRLWNVNLVGLWCGLISMACLAGVAAIPMSTVLWAHLLVSITHFAFAFFFVVLQTYINYYLPETYSKWNKFRIAICLCLSGFIGALVILFPLSHKKWKKLHSKVPALKLPEDTGFTLLFFSAGFEWLLYGAFLLFLLTFIFEYRNFQITIKVEPVDEESESTKTDS